MNLSNPANLLVAGIYFVLIAALSFFSLFGVYILIRYGRSVPFALTTSIIYTIFYLTILNQSYQALAGLLH